MSTFPKGDSSVIGARTLCYGYNNKCTSVNGYKLTRVDEIKDFGVIVDYK